MWSWLFDSQRHGNAGSAIALEGSAPPGEAEASALLELMKGTVLRLDAAGRAHGEQPCGDGPSLAFLDVLESGLLGAVHEEERASVTAQWRAGVAGGRTFELGARLYCERSSRWRSCLVRATPVRVVGAPAREWLVWLQDRENDSWVSREMGELVRRARESSREDGLGALAGGLAHQFNNLLHGIIGHADLIARRIDPASPLHASLSSIVGSSERAADICRQMLAYAGRGALLSTACNVSQLVDDLRLELEALCPPSCSLQLKLDLTLPAIKADPGQLRMALRNLVTNAAEASVGRAGTIRVRTFAQWLSAEELRGCASSVRLLPGSYVGLEVADEGIGIRQDILPRVFEPFVSSKFLGRGLGLAAVLGIARSLGGAVQVQSAETKGTRVRLLLPATSAANSNEQLEPTEQIGSTLLVVENEPCVRALLRLALESAGHRVVLAASIEAALELMERRGAHVDVLLLGAQARRDRSGLLDGLLDAYPRVPVLFLTDEANADLPRTGLPGLTIRRAVRQPWTISELLANVAATLSEQRSLMRTATDQSGTYRRVRESCVKVS